MSPLEEKLLYVTDIRTPFLCLAQIASLGFVSAQKRMRSVPSNINFITKLE